MLLHQVVVLLHCSLLCGVTAVTSCSIVTVDVANTSGDCSESSLLSDGLVNLICSSLHDVLTSLSKPSNRATEGNTECFEVRILRGHYDLRSNYAFTGRNISLVGEIEDDGLHLTTVSFSYPNATVTRSEYYVLSFVDNGFVEIRDLSFTESSGIIAAQNVASLLVENCSFRYFVQGAVDLYNCHFVTVQDCLFENNGPVAVVKSEPYKGHSGGLSFGYHTLQVEGGPRVLVSNCTFRNNTSDPVTAQGTSGLLQTFRFIGRGGGCAFIASSYTPLTAVLEDSTFEGNFARSFGGGLYLGFNGSQNHTVFINRSKLIRNECSGGGGGWHIGFADGRGDFINRMIVQDTEFLENQAVFGGGVYYMSADAGGALSSFALFRHCTFSGNRAKEYGAAIGAVNIRDAVDIEMDSCVFKGNDGGGGGVLSTARTPLMFRGNSSFIKNRGRTLVVLGAYVGIRGGLNFVDNNGAGIDGSAVYITSLGQLQLFSGANITFSGNIGVIGAAIVIDTLPVPPVYSRLAKNPLCALIYEDPSQRPDDWKNVFLGFSGNTAVIASGVYLNNLDLCSWVQNESPWFRPQDVFKWRFVEYSETNRNTAHAPDDFNQDWSVQTSAVDVKITSNTMTAYPGEQFTLGVQALDEIGSPTSDIIRITDLSENEAYLFEPSTITLSSIALAAINTSYLSPTEDMVYMSSRKLQVETLLGSTTFASAELRPRKCLPGHMLSLLHGSYRTCQCDTSNPSILECRGADITLRTGLWATADSSEAIVMYSCPSGYCRCVPITEGNAVHCHSVFSSTAPDSQCNCDRSGDLCGECRDGKGITALLNRCTDCHNASGLLIALLLALDAAVFVVLLALMKPLPSWVYPCVFYIQVLPYLTEHFPTTFDQIRPPLYYISSALSFYFVYDFCLYSNMSPLVSYFIRYLPLLLATVVVGAWFALMNRFRKNSLSWNGLWWIVVLMYTHILHTSMSILNCPMLPGRNDSHAPRWYVSGNVKCFTGGHAALGLLAIIILTLCVAVIPLSLAYNMGWIKRPRILKRVFEPLVQPFKERFKWWATVELTRRVLLVLFVVSIPRDEFAATVLLMVVLALYGFIQPYQDTTTNMLEIIFSINTIILLLLRSTRTVEDELGMPSVSQPGHNTTSECTDNLSINITAFAWILFPFYYSSLFIASVVAIVYFIRKIRSKNSQRKARKHQKSTIRDSVRFRRSAALVATTEVVVKMEQRPEDSGSVYSAVGKSGFADTVFINEGYSY